jgi:hypothetical protein
MKNIYILPTNKPSKLHYYAVLSLGLSKENLNWKQGRHIYITSDKEIKEGDWFHLDMSDNDRPDEIHQMGTNKRSKTGGINFSEPNSWTKSCKKIILTTDPDLIKDGVQAIDDEFLHWFVKNPSCEVVKVIHWEGYSDIGLLNYEIIIPQEEPKQDYSGVHLRHCYQGEYEDGCKYGENDCPAKPLEPKQEKLEEASWRFNPLKKLDGEFIRAAFIEGAKWQADRMYSEEESIQKIIDYVDFQFNTGVELNSEIKKWFKQFKKKRQ